MNATLIWHRKSAVLEAFEKEFNVTSLVRNEVNPSPYIRRQDEVVFSELIGADGKVIQGPAYQPREFPIGIWKVYAILDKNDEYEAPKFIATNAYQDLPAWDTVQKERLEYLRPIAELIRDTGYGIHDSTSPTTLGCGRMIESAPNNHDNILLLVDNIRFIWNKEGEGIGVSIDVRLD